MITPLSDYIKVTHGYAFPGDAFTEEPTGDLLLTPGNFAIGGGFQMGKGKYFSGDVPPEYVLPPGELVVTMTDLSKESDTLGYPAIVPSLPGLRILHNQRIGRVVFKRDNEIDKRFLYYVMCTRGYRHEVLASATGTGVKHTAPSRIEAYRFDFPSFSTQRAIAAVLGSLDDKIEQNRRTARALERLARAIFRAWFVDFEPVKAKAAGAASFPSMPQDAFDALPTTFTDSDLGPVPAGWKVRTLGDIFEIGVGGQWGEDEPNEKSTLAARCLRGIDCHELASGALPEVPLRYLKPDLAAKRTLADGVVLVEGSGSFCGRSFFWRNAYASLFREPVLYTNFTKRLDPRLSVSQSLVGWLHMRDAYDAGGMAAHRTGSAFPNLDLQGLLDTYPLAIPPRQISDSFADTFNALDDPHYIRESRKLAELRDYLLPQLLSGHVPVEVA